MCVIAFHVCIVEANKMHYFSNLFYFDTQLYMFRADLLSITRSLDTAIDICHTENFKYHLL